MFAGCGLTADLTEYIFTHCLVPDLVKHPIKRLPESDQSGMLQSLPVFTNVASACAYISQEGRTMIDGSMQLLTGCCWLPDTVGTRWP